MQAIKVTRLCSVSRFHMICGSWLFFMPVSTRQWFQCPFQWIWPGTIAAALMYHCPNWLTHRPLFGVKVLRLLSVMCICHKHCYLSWERACSQPEGLSSVEFIGFCWGIIKGTPSFMNSKAVCFFLWVSFSFLSRLIHQQLQPDSLPLLYSPQTHGLLLWPGLRPASLYRYIGGPEICVSGNTLLSSPC